jgi:hypothetical protein
MTAISVFGRFAPRLSVRTVHRYRKRRLAERFSQESIDEFKKEYAPQ